MNARNIVILACLILFGNSAYGGERVTLIPPEDKEDIVATSSLIVMEPACPVEDSLEEFDSSLGAAAALNKALALCLLGPISPDQVLFERTLTQKWGPEKSRWAIFAVEVLTRLKNGEEIPSINRVDLIPFDLAPSEPPEILKENPHIVVLRYNDEEYLERLLQRLYFKLMQGPVLLTVPYSGDAESVPEEYRHWHNFWYGPDSDPMTWNETRLVWVDWDLTQTVVLAYENGRIACFDSGRKYYIDHTAAVALTGAMLAHPRLESITGGQPLNYVLVVTEEK